MVTLLWPSSACGFTAVLGHQGMPRGLGDCVGAKIEVKSGKESFQHLSGPCCSYQEFPQWGEGAVCWHYEQGARGEGYWESSVPATLLSPQAGRHQPQGAVFSIIHCFSSVELKVLSKSILYHRHVHAALGHPAEVEP